MNREFSQDAENLIPDFRPSVFTDKVVISTYNYKHETNWSHRSRGLPTLIKHRTPTSPSPTAHNPPPHTTQHSQQPPPQQKQHHNNNKPNGNVVRVHVLMHAVLLQPLVHLPLILELVTVFPWKSKSKSKSKSIFQWHNKPNNKKATEKKNLFDKLQLAVIIKILTILLYFKMEIYGIVWTGSIPGSSNWEGVGKKDS